VSSEDLPPEGVHKDDILLAFDSAISTLMGMRMLLDRIIPNGAVLLEQEEGVCRHEHRAPSDPGFCLDCEQEVGVSSGFTGGEGS
jgi:hypothetical protein